MGWPVAAAPHLTDEVGLPPGQVAQTRIKEPDVAGAQTVSRRVAPVIRTLAAQDRLAHQAEGAGQLAAGIGEAQGQTQQLIDAASPHLTGQNFMATHWLITYALLAEETAQEEK